MYSTIILVRVDTVHSCISSQGRVGCKSLGRQLMPFYEGDDVSFIVKKQKHQTETPRHVAASPPIPVHPPIHTAHTRGSATHMFS